MPSHSRIFHHFECVQGQVTLGNFKMRCKHCRREVSGSCKATSNFYTHMKRHHADIHQELKEPLPASETAPREPRLTPPSSSSHPGAWNPRDPRQRALTDAVVDFLSHSLQPLSLVEDPSFKTLLKLAQPSFSLPSLDRLRYEVLPARTASLYSSVSSRLSKIPGLCLTLDVWAERGRGRGRGQSLVVGVAGHYIQDSSFRPRSVLLACRRVRGGSAEEREEGVLSNYQEVVSSFGLEDKVVTLITGSGVDDGPPVRLPGWEEEEEEEEEEDSDGENGVGTATEAASDPGPPLSLLPHCFPCFSRALESVVGDGLRRAGHLTSAAVRRASKLLADRSRREIASPGLFSDPQRQRQRQQQQQQRGWNAQARALRSVVPEIPEEEDDDDEEEEEEEEEKEELDQSWRPLPQPPPSPAPPSLSPSPANFPSDRLSDTELQALRELLGVLRPFELALEQAEGSGGGGGGGGAGGGEGGGGRGTASCVLPCIRGLRAELEEMVRRGRSEPLLLALRSSAESRLSGYEGEEAFVLAAALDPRWKLDWCSGAAEALEVKKLLAGKVAAMVASPEPNQNPVSSTLQTPPPPKKKKKRMTKVTQTRSGLFRFMGRSAPGSPQLGGAASGFTASQVEVYFSQPCIPEDADPLAFWYHHQGALPHLAHLAAMYLATPASPAPVRRLFSLSGGKTFGPLGASLSDFRFEEMMFLRCNGMWK